MGGNTLACLGLGGREGLWICRSRRKRLDAGCGWLSACAQAKNDKSYENGLPNLECQHR